MGEMISNNIDITKNSNLFSKFWFIYHLPIIVGIKRLYITCLIQVIYINKIPKTFAFNHLIRQGGTGCRTKVASRIVHGTLVQASHVFAFSCPWNVITLPRRFAKSCNFLYIWRKWRKIWFPMTRVWVVDELLLALLYHYHHPTLLRVASDV
jgi:hypothetical protein